MLDSALGKPITDALKVTLTLKLSEEIHEEKIENELHKEYA